MPTCASSPRVQGAKISLADDDERNASSIPRSPVRYVAGALYWARVCRVFTESTLEQGSCRSSDVERLMSPTHRHAHLSASNRLTILDEKREPKDVDGPWEDVPQHDWAALIPRSCSLFGIMRNIKYLERAHNSGSSMQTHVFSGFSCRLDLVGGLIADLDRHLGDTAGIA